MGENEDNSVEIDSQSIDALINLSNNKFASGDIKGAIEGYKVKIPEIENNPQLSNERSKFFANYGKLLVNNIFMNNHPISEVREILDKAEQDLDESDLELKSMVIDQQGLTSYYENLTKENPDYEPALNLFTTGLEIRKGVGDKRLLSESYFHVGLIQERTGKQDKAMQTYQTSYDFAKEVDAKLEQSFAIRHIGFIYARKKEVKSAIKALEESLQLRLEINHDISLPFSYASLGDAFNAVDRRDKAIINYEKGYNISKQIGNTRGLMLNAYSRGRTLKQLKILDSAKEYLLEAKELATKFNHEAALKLINQHLDELV